MENKSGIYPTGYRVLIKPDPVEEFTAGGILLRDIDQDAAQRQQQTGDVVELGPDAYKDKRSKWAKAGDRVFFSRYEGDIVCGEDGEDYRLINDTAVLAHVSEDVRLGELDVPRSAFDANP